MRLTGKDAVATMLAGLAVLVVLAVTEGWGWPLLGSPRAGVLALGVIGVGMCASGSRVGEQTSMRDPFIAVAMVLGIGSLVLIVLGLIVGSEALLVTLGATILALWLVTTLRHAIESPRRPITAAR
jgi:hypothetical protein